MLLVQTLENYKHISLVLTQGSFVQQNIIEIHNYKVLKEVKKYPIHQTIKGGWHIGQSKGHNNLFKWPKAC